MLGVVLDVESTFARVLSVGLVGVGDILIFSLICARPTLGLVFASSHSTRRMIDEV